MSAPAGLALIDSGLRVIRANDAMGTMVGVSPEEMVGWGPDVLVPKIAPSVEPILRSVAATGVPALNFPVVGETPAQPGVTRYWKVSIFAIKKWGKPTGFIGAIVVEVTEQIQFQLLDEAESIAMFGSWEWDLLTGAVTCSPNLRRMLGIDSNHAQLSVEQLRERIRPEDREMVRTVTKCAIKDGQPHEYYARFHVADGQVRTLYTRGRPVFDSVNKFVKLVGVTQDVTEKMEAERALVASEERYRDLIENSQDLMCTHDLDGCVTWMNDLPARILGYSAQQLIGHRIPELLAPETRSQFTNYIEQIHKTGRAEGVMQLVSRSGERRFWEYRNTLRREGVPAPIVRGVAHDITERKRAQDALRKNEALVRGLFETAQKLTGTLELSVILDLLNLQAMHLTDAEGACAGLRRKEGFSCDSFYDDQTRKNMAFIWPPGVGVPGWVLQNKKTYLTNNAENDPLIPTEVRTGLSLRNVLCVPVFDIPRKEVVAFFALHNKSRGFEQRDVEMAEGISTVASVAIQNSLAYKTVCQKEDELDRLSSRLITSQDDERRRIARDLHERTAQDLVALNMQVSSLKYSGSKLSTEAIDTVDRCKQIINGLCVEIRTLSYSLHPHLLEALGIEGTIESCAQAFSRATGITVKVEIPDKVGHLTQDEKTTIYRIVQEALTNIRRHSHSKTAVVSLKRESDQIKLEIEDFGQGLPSDSKYVPAGLGIVGMTQRIQQHGGTTQIESVVGKGLRIRAQFPVHGMAKAVCQGVNSHHASEISNFDRR